MQSVQPTLQPTELEQQIFDDLLSAARQAGLGTTLRCAGGWVRDKLMGRQSLDIDIALDDTLGAEFGERVNEYLKAHGQEVHRVAVISSNPEQSKHLETARMRVRGLWLDLVNLRSEEYAQHSRIPTMEFGTAEQDALRRDFTINSMFYNINTGMVEDYTGRGLADLRRGLIRTPLPAKETFLDDPLRVLRAVRFAARFAFELDASLLEAAQDSQVRDMLGHKVSRERIGAELDGMLGGPDPVAAVRLLQRMGLFEAVFEVHPSTGADVAADFAAAGAALLAAAHDILEAWGPPGAAPAAEERRQALLAALLLPLRGVQLRTAKGKQQSMSAHVIRDSLKWKNKDCEAVDDLHRCAPRLLAAHQALGAGGAAPDEARVALGRCIRELRSLWRLGCVLAAVLPAPEAHPLGVDAPQDDGAAAASPELRASVDAEAAASGQDGARLQQRVEVCEALAAAAEGFGLVDCWQWKPVLDGKQVMAALGMTRGGPALGRLMDKVVDWQLVHPGGSAEECLQWLQQNREEVVPVLE